VRFLLILLFSVSAQAKSKSTDFQLTVNFGEKVSKFELKKKVLLVNGQKKNISEKNLDYVATLVEKAVKAKSNNRNLCARSYMKLAVGDGETTQPKEIIGCINSPNPTSEQLTELANTLLIL
jgi:hypothetical protein